MCLAMAATLQNQEVESDECLRKQLAAIVKTIQWSYAIFWSLSASQPGMLDWSNGYYNGDIKTRKTTQATELKVDRWGLQRSEQLRELYVSLSAGDSNQQARRPSASLSPEDLTDSEWYYLVCMSFTFCHDQGVPGRTLSSGNHIWLCNAHLVKSKIFSRSLLAKSASIQTVICFPFMNGVLELGTTEHVVENEKLIKQLTDTFWEFPESVCFEQSLSSPQSVEDHDEQALPYVDQEILSCNPSENINLAADYQLPTPLILPSCGPSRDTDFNEDSIDDIHANIIDELKRGFPDCNSNECCPNQQTDDSFMLEGVNGTSLVQSWQFVDDEFSGGIHGSLKSSDCLSHSFVNPRRIVQSLKEGRSNSHNFHACNKLSSLDIGNDDSHYKSVLCAILGKPVRHSQVPYLLKGPHASGFTAWKKGMDAPKQHIDIPQKMLKCILFSVAGLHDKFDSENRLDDKITNFEGDGTGLAHAFSEKRREKLNEKFLLLRSLVPSVSKVDKVSILDDTIDYLRDLERRVEELGSCRDLGVLEAKGRKQHPDITERTSDNYGHDGVLNGWKTCINKRKASEQPCVRSQAGLEDVSVTIVDKEATIVMHCPWRECLLLEIVDAFSNLCLDAHSIQSTIEDGFLSLTVKSKFRGTMLASPGMIKQALFRVVGKW